MKRFFISITQCIIQGIAIIFLYIPKMYVVNDYSPMKGFLGAWTKTASFDWSFQEITNCLSFNMPEILRDRFIVLMYLVLIFTVISTISYYTNQKHLIWAQHKLGVIAPSITLVLFVVMTIIYCLPPERSYTSGYSEVGVGILFYFEILLFVLNIALDAFKHFAPINETKIVQKSDTNISTRIEPAVNIPGNKYDELKKLKELYDMGILTQKEFDTKKEQLLNQ